MDPRNGRKFDGAIKFFKASMTFKNLDSQYPAVREIMAAIYCDDETLFGPIEAPTLVNCHRKIR